MQYTNKYKLPSSLVDVITGNNYDISQSNPYRIGITTLLNPPIQRLLAIKYWNEMEEDVSEHLWRLLGSACHEVVSKIDDSNRMIEEKFEYEIDGVTIVGKLDLYDWETEAIEDWKVTSVWSIQLGDKADWERQLNCYAFLLRAKGLPVSKLSINAIIKDWRKGELTKYPDYPPIPFVRKMVKLWTFEEQEKYIKERVALYKQEIPKPIENVEICPPKDRWKKEDIFAVYKNKLKNASRLLNSEEEAKEWITGHIKAPDTARIELRRGTDLKCTEYCGVSKFCPYWQEIYGDK